MQNSDNRTCLTDRQAQITDYSIQIKKHNRGGTTAQASIFFSLGSGFWACLSVRQVLCSVFYV